MNDFKRDYLHLLREQVELEMALLARHAHTDVNTTACPFCYESKGKYRCNRVQELKNFHSQIVVEQNRKRPEFVSSPDNLSALPLVSSLDQ